MSLLLIAYILGYIAIFPRVFRFFIEDTVYGQPDSVDVGFAGGLSVFFTLFWPVLVIGFFLKLIVFDPLADRIIKEYKENR